jgi:hypothetical protein
MVSGTASAAVTHCGQLIVTSPDPAQVADGARAPLQGQLTGMGAPPSSR